jgi:1-acyl-sn-glycerol-3-phosphate acyltransferase
VSVALFPEGTRSETGAIGRFKLGAFHLAMTKKRPVVPVVLGGARDVLPKHSLVFKKHALITVRVLDPVPTEGVTDTEALAAEVRERMIAAHREIEPEIRDP